MTQNIFRQLGLLCIVLSSGVIALAGEKKTITYKFNPNYTTAVCLPSAQLEISDNLSSVKITPSSQDSMQVQQQKCESMRQTFQATLDRALQQKKYVQLTGEYTSGFNVINLLHFRGLRDSEITWHSSVIDKPAGEYFLQSCNYLTKEDFSPFQGIKGDTHTISRALYQDSSKAVVVRKVKCYTSDNMAVRLSAKCTITKSHEPTAMECLQEGFPALSQPVKPASAKPKAQGGNR